MTYLEEDAIKLRVEWMTSYMDYIDTGTLENEIEQMFPSEERDGRCPDGLHEAMIIAELHLKKQGYQLTERLDGYERIPE